jgi:hypothetical protein
MAGLSEIMKHCMYIGMADEVLAFLCGHASSLVENNCDFWMPDIYYMSMLK